MKNGGSTVSPKSESRETATVIRSRISRTTVGKLACRLSPQGPVSMEHTEYEDVLCLASSGARMFRLDPPKELHRMIG